MDGILLPVFDDECLYVADVDFGGTFFMFRNALQTFVEIVRGERKNESRAITMKVMDILERGNKG